MCGDGETVYKVITLPSPRRPHCAFKIASEAISSQNCINSRLM